jgi:hypothetical protein
MDTTTGSSITKSKLREQKKHRRKSCSSNLAVQVHLCVTTISATSCQHLHRGRAEKPSPDWARALPSRSFLQWTRAELKGLPDPLCGRQQTLKETVVNTEWTGSVDDVKAG